MTTLLARYQSYHGLSRQNVELVGGYLSATPGLLVGRLTALTRLTCGAIHSCGPGPCDRVAVSSSRIISVLTAQGLLAGVLLRVANDRIANTPWHVQRSRAMVAPPRTKRSHSASVFVSQRGPTDMSPDGMAVLCGWTLYLRWWLSSWSSNKPSRFKNLGHAWLPVRRACRWINGTYYVR
jgi:hypothetical protein